jgi:hypothetical protein
MATMPWFFCPRARNRRSGHDHAGDRPAACPCAPSPATPPRSGQARLGAGHLAPGFNPGRPLHRRDHRQAAAQGVGGDGFAAQPAGTADSGRTNRGWLADRGGGCGD